MWAARRDPRGHSLLAGPRALLRPPGGACEKLQQLRRQDPFLEARLEHGPHEGAAPSSPVAFRPAPLRQLPHGLAHLATVSIAPSATLASKRFPNAGSIRLKSTVGPAFRASRKGSEIVMSTAPLPPATAWRTTQFAMSMNSNKPPVNSQWTPARRGPRHASAMNRSN